MIKWDDSMSTGIDNIDAQHKELIDNFDALLEAVAQGRGREETGEILDFLQFYSQWHFEREEHYMAEYNCPAAEENIEAHNVFRDRFGQLYEQYQSSNVDMKIMADTVNELTVWVLNHIITVDAQLYPCVADQDPDRY